MSGRAKRRHDAIDNSSSETTDQLKSKNSTTPSSSSTSTTTTSTTTTTTTTPSNRNRSSSRKRLRFNNEGEDENDHTISSTLTGGNGQIITTTTTPSTTEQENNNNNNINTNNNNLSEYDEYDEDDENILYGGGDEDDYEEDDNDDNDDDDDFHPSSSGSNTSMIAPTSTSTSTTSATTSTSSTTSSTTASSIRSPSKSPSTPSSKSKRKSSLSSPLTPKSMTALDEDYSTSSRKRKPKSTHSLEPPSTGQLGKGLRHFSMRVCQKVKQKGTTTYNEVADELVSEISLDMSPSDKGSYDHKNIRRRVYDALNVLMAMNIIEKDRKDIRWISLPTNAAHECEQLLEAKSSLSQTIKAKKEHIRELLIQEVAFESLVKRNNEAQLNNTHNDKTEIIKLPFIIVKTHKDTEIDCQMEEDRTEYFFDFKQPFEVLDDIEILKRMGMSQGLETGLSDSTQMEEIRKIVDPQLLKYVENPMNSRPSNNDYTSPSKLQPSPTSRTKSTPSPSSRKSKKD